MHPKIQDVYDNTVLSQRPPTEITFVRCTTVACDDDCEPAALRVYQVHK